METYGPDLGRVMELGMYIGHVIHHSKSISAFFIALFDLAHELSGSYSR